jgi:hypothetical protein
MDWRFGLEGLRSWVRRRLKFMFERSQGRHGTDSGRRFFEGFKVKFREFEVRLGLFEVR